MTRAGDTYDLTGWSPEQRAELAALLREAVAAGGWRMQALGSSMEPTLPGGSRLEVGPLPRAVPLGALLVFLPLDGPHPVCHRVVEVTDDGVMLVAGDRGGRPDHRVERRFAVGVVEAFVLGGKRFAPGGAPPSGYRRLRARLARVLARLSPGSRDAAGTTERR